MTEATRTRPRAAEPRPPASTADEDFGRALGVLLRSYRALVSQALGAFPHGPRGYQTLFEVVHGEQPSQLALATRLGVDRTVMTYLIDDLVAAGLVRREPNPADRRQRRVVATEKGRRTLAAVCAEVTRAENESLAALGPDEREVFRRLLFKAACGQAAHHSHAAKAVDDTHAK